MKAFPRVSMDASCCVNEACTAASIQPSVHTSPIPTLKSLEEIQHVMEVLQRVQLLQEHRITELERQLKSHNGSVAEFPYFSRLPPELRCQIWELALPVQIFRPFRYLQPSFLEWTSVNPPPISRVCREARYVAHRHGAFYCHEFLAPMSWAWFNGHKDILDLSPYRIPKDGFIPLEANLLKEAKTILLDVDHVDNRLIAGLFGQGGRLPNIRTIYLMAGNIFQAERQSWHPHAVARLFRDQSFAHVDIEDDEEVEQLEQLLLDMASASDGSFTDKWHRDTITRLQTQIQPPATVMGPWKKAKQLLMQGWMSYNADASSLGIESNVKGDGMTKEDEVRKRYPQMPAIKIVQVFELSPVVELAKWYKDYGRQYIEDVRG
ncbi:hypothetical protein THARTR1_09719 [Trichoderma harzianum]|uniref:2EXR domain-containing protein n=1 Tax=Trichoderma harzianum TaxID=5544 RepID=A0A2K0TV45_TRIHA|nr:hypothetical protein THARTR1_09719 [Trichoderma harzianum]